MRARLAATLVALALAACAPRVDPRSPFDEDDPRARATEAPAPAPLPRAPADDATGPIVIPAGDARTGTVTREALRIHLDAGPAAFLRWFDIEAELDAGAFAGWRLIRLLTPGRPLAAYDLRPGDILRAVNGHPVSKPAELAALWLELYGAPAIVADLSRAGARFELRIEIDGAPLPAPTSLPGGPGPVAPAAATPAASAP